MSRGRLQVQSASFDQLIPSRQRARNGAESADHSISFVDVAFKKSAELPISLGNRSRMTTSNVIVPLNLPIEAPCLENGFLDVEFRRWDWRFLLRGLQW